MYTNDLKSPVFYGGTLFEHTLAKWPVHPCYLVHTAMQCIENSHRSDTAARYLGQIVGSQTVYLAVHHPLVLLSPCHQMTRIFDHPIPY